MSLRQHSPTLHLLLRKSRLAPFPSWRLLRSKATLAYVMRSSSPPRSRQATRSLAATQSISRKSRSSTLSCFVRELCRRRRPKASPRGTLGEYAVSPRSDLRSTANFASLPDKVVWRQSAPASREFSKFCTILRGLRENRGRGVLPPLFLWMLYIMMPLQFLPRFLLV